MKRHMLAVLAMVCLVLLMNVLWVPILLQWFMEWAVEKIDQFGNWISDTRYGRWLGRRLDRIELWLPPKAPSRPRNESSPNKTRAPAAGPNPYTNPPQTK